MEKLCGKPGHSVSPCSHTADVTFYEPAFASIVSDGAYAPKCPVKYSTIIAMPTMIR